jgi:hypothetical protein
VVSPLLGLRADQESKLKLMIQPGAAILTYHLDQHDAAVSVGEASILKTFQGILMGCKIPIN